MGEPSALRRPLSRQGAGDLTERQGAANPVGRDIADGKPKPFSRPPQPAPRDGHFQHNNRLNPAAVAAHRVKGCPSRFVRRVQPDHLEPALALGAEQVAFQDAGKWQGVGVPPAVVPWLHLAGLDRTASPSA